MNHVQHWLRAAVNAAVTARRPEVRWRVTEQTTGGCYAYIDDPVHAPFGYVCVRHDGEIRYYLGHIAQWRRCETLEEAIDSHFAEYVSARMKGAQP